ncbi:MAG: RHS repeat-associated core domain-containing protein, partial [Rhodoglobus sp.]
NVACGVYFIVTDHIGKPVLALNASRKISSVGEYTPSGSMNRVEWWWSTSNPQTKYAEGPYFTGYSQKELGMEVNFRNHFPLVDTEQDPCNGNAIREGPSIWNGALSVMYEVVGGYAKGDVWSQWWPGYSNAGSRSMYIGWGTLAGNCNPTNCSAGCPQPAGKGWSYAGFVHREYEYRRFEAGVTPYFPKLRFPGHYFDEETDLNENWHRYYSPFLGSRYLSPEPLLQRPGWVKREAEQGYATPTYAYARNNPVRHTDPTGLNSLMFGAPVYPNLPPDADPGQKWLCMLGFRCNYEPPKPPPGTCPIPGQMWKKKKEPMVCTLSPNTPAPVPGQLQLFGCMYNCPDGTTVGPVDSGDLPCDPTWTVYR